MDRPIYSIKSHKWVGELEKTRGNNENADLNPVLAISHLQSDDVKGHDPLTWHLIQ